MAALERDDRNQEIIVRVVFFFSQAQSSKYVNRSWLLPVSDDQRFISSQTLAVPKRATNNDQ